MVSPITIYDLWICESTLTQLIPFPTLLHNVSILCLSIDANYKVVDAIGRNVFRPYEEDHKPCVGTKPCHCHVTELDSFV